MRKSKDNYTKQERQEYNRHYYPNNKERMQEQRKSPIAVRRRKMNRIRLRYQKQITAILDKMAQEIALLQNPVTTEQHDEAV